MAPRPTVLLLSHTLHSRAVVVVPTMISSVAFSAKCPVTKSDVADHFLKCCTNIKFTLCPGGIVAPPGSAAVRTA